MKTDKPHKKTITQIFKEGLLIDEAVRAGAREALLRHRGAHQPLVGMRDGKIVWVSPDELEVPE